MPENRVRVDLNSGGFIDIEELSSGSVVTIKRADGSVEVYQNVERVEDGEEIVGLRIDNI